MSTDSTARRWRDDLLERELTQQIINVFFCTYNELGYGFVESVYARAMAIALREAGLMVAQEVDVQVPFHGRPVGFFRADLIVDASVVVELNAGRSLYMEHEQQLLNYLRATTLEVGLLLNFGPRPTFRRLVYSNQRKSRYSGVANEIKSRGGRW